ncbi:MAG TPA: VWA domain-containing protein [Gemmatimonadales bacterium]|nr:VWA domain-containing protein [Gemmatimonadales bacterium]
MRFEWPWLLWMAPLVAGLVWGLAFLARRARVRAASAWSPALGQEAARRGRHAGLVLAATALMAMAAAAGPRFGRVQVDVESRALNLILAVDISRSMLAEDAAPSRLVRSVGEARRVLLDAGGDRVGLIAFAGRSYILAPLTLDAAAVQLYLDHLDPDIASEGGSDLTAVLRQGGELLGAASQGGDRALVIFTDGEGHDSLPFAVEAAARLRADGVSLILVSQGGEAPAPIPVRDSVGTMVGYQQHEGAPVETRRRDDILRAIATAAAGTLVAADVADQAGAVRAVLASLERRPARERQVEDLLPRAWIGALMAFGLLLAHSATRRTAALAALALMIGTQAGVAQRPSEGERLLQRGERAAAAERLAREAQQRPTSDSAWYNAGTAALAAGQFADARAALATSARSVDPELRFRSLYNLGLAALLEARADTARSEALLGEAVEHLRQAVLLRPDAQAARWNLELATRTRPPPQSGGGGGGGPPPPGGGQPSPTSGPGGMTPEQAAAILAAVEQSERAVREGQVTRRRGMAARTGRDW